MVFHTFLFFCLFAHPSWDFSNIVSLFCVRVMRKNIIEHLAKPYSFGVSEYSFNKFVIESAIIITKERN